MKIIFDEDESRADAVVALTVAESTIKEDMNRNLDLAEDADRDDIKAMFAEFAVSDHQKLKTIRKMLEAI